MSRKDNHTPTTQDSSGPLTGGSASGALQNECDQHPQLEAEIQPQGQLPALSNITPQRGLFDTSRINAITGGRFIQTNDNHANLIVNFNQYGRDFSEETAGSNRNAEAPPAPKKTRKRTRVRRPKVPSQADIRANAIYERHMLTKHRGYPLWIPECSLNLPVEKQKEGIAIGDVGLITSSGGFSFLFNITLAADHPFQPTEMPDGFKPIPAPKPRDIRVFNELKPYTSLTSVSVEEVHPENTMESGEHVFQSSPEEGAILTLPNGATTLDLEARGIWRGYMAKHIESWYKYVNGVLGREANNGDIRLALGCDKASCWGMAAVSGQARNPQGHELRFCPVEGRRAKVRHVWTCTGVVDTRTGPTVSELQKLGIGGEAEQNNQCLFIRTMNGMMGEEQWEKLNKEIAAILLPDEFPSTAPGPSGSSSSSKLSTTTTTTTTPASSSSSELSTADALDFLESIKDRFGQDPGIYNRLLNIMKDSKNDVISDCRTAIEKVAILFYETAPDVLQAFNKFIPPGYQVYPYIYPRASNNVAIETPQSMFVLNTVTGEVHQAPDLAIEGPSDNLSFDKKMRVRFVAAVKVRLREDPSTYHQFLNILGRSQQTMTSDLTGFDKSDLVRQLSSVFQNHHDLLQGANAAIGTPGYQLRLICHPRPCNKLLVVTPDTSSFILDVNTGENLGPPSVDLCYTNTHPGDVLNHFLLQESPTSRAVITTDDDWIWPSLLDQGSSFEFPTDETLLGSILLSRRIRLYNGKSHSSSYDMPQSKCVGVRPILDVVMLDPHQAPEPEQAKVTPTHQLEILDREAQEHGRHLTNSSSASLHLYLVPALDALRFFHRTIPGYNRATDDTWSEEIYRTPVVQRFIEVLDSWMINDNQKLIRSKVGSSSGEDSAIISSVKSLLHQKGTQAPAFIDTVSAEEAVRGFASRLALPFRPVIEFYLRYRLFGSTASLEKCVDGLKSIVDFNMSGTPQRLLSDDELPLIVSDQASSTPSSSEWKKRKIESTEDETGDVKMDSDPAFDDADDIKTSHASSEVVFLRQKIQDLTLRYKMLESQLYVDPRNWLSNDEYGDEKARKHEDSSVDDAMEEVESIRVKHQSADDAMEGIQFIKVEDIY